MVGCLLPNSISRKKLWDIPAWLASLLTVRPFCSRKNVIFLFTFQGNPLQSWWLRVNVNRFAMEKLLL